MTQSQFRLLPKRNLILGSNDHSKFLIWSSALFWDSTTTRHTFHFFTIMPCLEFLLPHSFQRLSIFQGSFPPEACPYYPGMKWFFLSHEAVTEYLLCAKNCAWKITFFFHCTLNPYNSPMKYRPLLLLVYRKGNWGTIGMIKSNNATNWTKHFSCVTILSTQRAHLIGTLPIISTWLTRKLRFRGVILPKFPQRWEDSDKLSLLTLEPHELSNEGSPPPLVEPRCQLTWKSAIHPLY